MIDVKVNSTVLETVLNYAQILFVNYNSQFPGQVEILMTTFKIYISELGCCPG